MIYNFWNTKTESRIKYLLVLGYKDILVVIQTIKLFILLIFKVVF